MNDDENEKYEVGYGRPPKRTQFKKGQSGNRGGRPKKLGTTLSEDIQAELRAPIEIKENGKLRKIPKQRAVAKQIVNKAVSGNDKCLALLIKADEQNLDGPDKLPEVLEGFRAQHDRVNQTPLEMPIDLASGNKSKEALGKDSNGRP